MAKAEPTSAHTGRWLVVSARGWEQDYIDEEEGRFAFDDNGGDFHFDYVHGPMNC